MAIRKLKATIFLFVTVSVLVRCGVSLHKHSGEGKSPLFGDYEAQRHWQEITLNIPVKEWYHNTSRNDLQYWGLDYPPLTAYHSLLCGYVARIIDPEYVSLYHSRGMEKSLHKLFMRSTVLAADMLIFIPAVVYFCFVLYKKDLDAIVKNSDNLTKSEHKNQSTRYKVNVHNLKKNDDMFNSLIKPLTPFLSHLLAILLYPGLILIDHGHFQYNNISLGFFVFAVAFILQEKHLLASTFFVFALNYKQMELYHALPFFFYLLSHSFKNRSYVNGAIQLVKIGSCVMTVFLFIWIPFLDVENILQILHRIFPVARGVFEDKVSNVWCTLNVIIKLKHMFDSIQMGLICLACTAVTIFPTNLFLFLNPNITNFKYALLNTSIAFFLFSFQVHEKSILLAVIPALLLFRNESYAVLWFQYIATFSMVPLLFKDSLLNPYLALNVLYFVLFHMCYSTNSNKNSYSFIPPFQILADHISKLKLVEVFSFLSLSGSILLLALFICVSPPQYLPDLYPLLISVYSCLHFIMLFIYFNVKQFFTVSSSTRFKTD